MNKIIDIKEKLKLVVHNKKWEKIKRDKKGQNAIAKLKNYNDFSEKLIIIEDDLFNKRISVGTFNYIKWYLDELLSSEPSSFLEEILFNWANYLFEYLDSGNVKIIKPRKVKPKKPVPPVK